MYVPEYLGDAFVYYEKIKNNPNYLIQAYNDLVEQQKSIASMPKDKYYYEIVMGKANIKEIEKYLLTSMTNEQIQELANSSLSYFCFPILIFCYS